MENSHKNRMRQIGSVALPPKGTIEYDRVAKYLKKTHSKELEEYIESLWEKSFSIVTAQQLNGAGHQTDQAIRWYQQEYNNRIWSHGLHSLPSSFNVAEAFLNYRPDLNTLFILNEVNHLFSFPNFVDWYTSVDITFEPKSVLKNMEQGVIYTFDSLVDPAELLYNIEKGSEIGIAGFAMVRFGTEVSVMCIGGESTNLELMSTELADDFSRYKTIKGRKEITPDPDLSVEAVALTSRSPLWRLIALTRFDIEDMSQSVRYIFHDAGNLFRTITDDPTNFLDTQGNPLDENNEAILAISAKEVQGYNALFDLCGTALFLPLYFDEHIEDIIVERLKTNYAEEVRKVSFKKILKNIPIKQKIAYRNVNVLRNKSNNLETREIIYSAQNFHMETSGYWRTLEPGKFGTDKNGNPMHGKTWVSKKLSWMEAEEPCTLKAKWHNAQPIPEGLNPGYIYIMRSPLHSKNVFKIGLTTRSTEIRANELSSATGVPGRVYVINQWPVSDCETIEKKIHNRLADYRVDPRREFFEGSLEFFITTVNEVIHESDL